MFGANLKFELLLCSYRKRHFLGYALNIRRNLFAQVLGFISWAIVMRIVDGKSADAAVHSVNSAKKYRYLISSHLTKRQDNSRYLGRAGRRFQSVFLESGCEGTV